MASKRYDHPAYEARAFTPGSANVGGGTATPAAHIDAHAAMLLHEAHFTVATAGTATAAAFRVINVSGTTTTTVGSVTAGTSAANTTLSLGLTAPTDLAEDSITYAITVSDATLAGRVTWETSIKPGATIA